MPINAIVRVSFQSVVPANQAANKALVGVTHGNSGTGPFTKVGTALYSCTNADDLAVGLSMAELGNVLRQYASDLDFVSISLGRVDTAN